MNARCFRCFKFLYKQIIFIFQDEILSHLSPIYPFLFPVNITCITTSSPVPLWEEDSLSTFSSAAY